MGCCVQFRLVTSDNSCMTLQQKHTSSVSPELLQSPANICLQKSPFTHDYSENHDILSKKHKQICSAPTLQLSCCILSLRTETKTNKRNGRQYDLKTFFPCSESLDIGKKKSMSMKGAFSLSKGPSLFVEKPSSGGYE